MPRGAIALGVTRIGARLSAIHMKSGYSVEGGSSPYDEFVPPRPQFLPFPSHHSARETPFLTQWDILPHQARTQTGSLASTISPLGSSLNPIVFPISEYWWVIAAFLALMGCILTVDLLVFGLKRREPSFRASFVWTLTCVSIAVLCSLGFWMWAHQELHAHPELLENSIWFNAGPSGAARELFMQFSAAYAIEVSLSIDNLFVFIVLFRYFAIPRALQHRVLFYGILGAIVFRGIFIAIGTGLAQFEWTLIVMGAFLILTGYKVLRSDGMGDATPHPDRNVLVRTLKYVLPITDGFRGHRFFVRENGVLFATPLMIALCVVETTDIVFAVDSVPAVLGISREPIVAFASNVLAILGLRAMFFVVAEAMQRFYLLKYGLGLVLIFVGAKMTFLGRFFEDGHFPITLSLAVIATLIGGCLVLSVLFPPASGTKASEPNA